MEIGKSTHEDRRRMFSAELKEMGDDPQIQSELRQIEWEFSGRRLSVPCQIIRPITLENLIDIWEAKRGRIRSAEVRRVTITDSVVDTSIPFLCIPSNVVRDLGLLRTGETKYIGSTFTRDVAMFQPVHVTILGQLCTMDVLEIPDGLPLIIGNLIVTHLDLNFDAHNRRLVEYPV